MLNYMAQHIINSYNTIIIYLINIIILNNYHDQNIKTSFIYSLFDCEGASWGS